ncbi:MAG: hypothetical protein LBP64_03960 [Tannerella sp.]|jgi:hypothetical protein|nr:hypothetical protein [Tannerella sp.]
MTRRSGTLEKPDAEFLAQANTINTQCNLNKAGWAIDPDRLTEFDSLLKNANHAYEVNSDKATRNAMTSAAKKAAFGELKHFLGIFIDYLEVNTNVPDEALAFMDLRPRQHHASQPLPPPKEMLVLLIRKLHDEMTLYASRPEQGHPVESTGPKHYHGFMIRYKLEGEANYRTAVSTRLHHTIFFDHADEGKHVYISAAWVNPRLEPGPWSDEITEIIG